MKKEILAKIQSCKALQGKTVEELIATDRFHDNLAAYMTAQREDRKQIRASYEAMRKVGGAKGFKLPAHPLDALESLPTEELAIEYAKVVAGGSTRGHAQRKYIRQIGQQAYNLTVAQMVVEEYPELESVLIPKAKAN